MSAAVPGASVTVAVATCGRTADLDVCLRAVAAQTAAPARLLVVDQQPSEEARAMASAAGAEYLEQARSGLSASRNLALRETRTELLAVTDEDCAPDPEWVAAISRAAVRAPAPVAVTGPILPLGERPEGGHALSLRDSLEPRDYSGRIVPWGVGSGGNFAARVADLRDAGGWDERLGAGTRGMAAEDADLIYRLLLSGGIVRYEPAAVVRHAWSTPERRMQTRWSYGYGVGALGGIRLARRDSFAWSMLKAYAVHHGRLLAGTLRRREGTLALGHWRALVSLAPGIAYGWRSERAARRRP